MLFSKKCHLPLTAIRVNLLVEEPDDVEYVVDDDDIPVERSVREDDDSGDELLVMPSVCHDSEVSCEVRESSVATKLEVGDVVPSVTVAPSAVTSLVTTVLSDVTGESVVSTAVDVGGDSEDDGACVDELVDDKAETDVVVAGVVVDEIVLVVVVAKLAVVVVDADVDVDVTDEVGVIVVVVEELSTVGAVVIDAVVISSAVVEVDSTDVAVLRKKCQKWKI